MFDDLADDRGESENLAEDEPERAQKLKSELQQILKDAKARMPEGMISRN